MCAKSKSSKIFVVLIAVVFMLGVLLVHAMNSTTVLAAPHYAYSIDKMVTGITNPDTTDGGSVVNEVGDAISYQVVVENTGIGGGPKLDLSMVTLYDSLIGGYLGSPDAGDADGDEWLDYDETWYWYYTYTVTQTDIDTYGGGDCDIDNTATVGCDQLGPISWSVAVPIVQNQAYITVVKEVINDDGGNALPDDFLLTLDGVPVTSGVAVPVDPGTHTVGETLLPGYTFIGFSGDCDSNGNVTIAVGESKTCTLTNDDQSQIIIQTEPDTRVILNICPCPLEEHDIYPGDRLVLRVKETNTGDEPLSGVYVTLSPGGYTLEKGDAYYRGGDTNGNDELDPAETWVWAIIVEAEHDVLFQATGHGWSSSLGEDITWPEYPNERDSVYVDVIEPALSIIKNGTWVDENDNGYADVGEVIEYTFSVTNEGDHMLTNVNVTDPKVTVVGGPIVLDVGETDTTTFTGTYTITQADIEAGYVDNTATADSDESGPASDDETVELPAITIQIIPDTTVTLVASAYTVYSGSTVDLTVTEANTGDDPLTNPYVWVGRLDPATGLVIQPSWGMGKGDDHYIGGDTNNDGILDPGETWTWEIPDVEIVGDGVFIIAKGHGRDSSDNDVAWPEYPNERDIIAVNTITIQTTPDTQVYLNIYPSPLQEHDIYPGDTLVLTVKETNTGDEPLTDPYVWVGGIDPATGLVIDINIGDTEANGWAMGKDDDHYVSGDTNDDGILDPGEIWGWIISDVEVNEDVLVIAKGHGWSCGLGEDIAYPDYQNERDKIYVEVIDDR